MRHLLTLPILFLAVLACGLTAELPSTSMSSPDAVSLTAPIQDSTAELPESTLVVETSQPGPIQATSINLIPKPENVRLVPAQVADGMIRPTVIANAGDGSGRLFLVEQRGVVRIYADGSLQSVDAPFLDISSLISTRANEQGLLGLAFHPDYESNGYFYVNYTSINSGITTVSRLTVSDNPAFADPSSEEILLQVRQPAGNHNGGNLVFGPDGYLYIGLGDGGGQNDQYGNGQNLSTLLGTILRIDVNGGLPYNIPPDNPFLNSGSALEEIWAYGLRNPWRFSFDRLTGDLYIADVGQWSYEEVNFQSESSSGGENYGWPIMEGMHCVGSSCDQSRFMLPITEYGRDDGCSITGGYVYRGRAIPDLYGAYIFSDYCSGTLWTAYQTENGNWQAVIVGQVASPSTFGEDENGELYVTDHANGVLYSLTRP